MITKIPVLASTLCISDITLITYGTVGISDIHKFKSVQIGM